MILRWLDRTTLPVEMAHLTPEAMLGLASVEVAKLPVRVGNQTTDLGDLFSVDNGDENILILEGDLSHVRGIGRGMSEGRLIVRGQAGPYLGAGMSGGLVEVDGDSGDWAGAEMRGGCLRIKGRAGRFLGASYPGSRLGMREGVILVEGDVGDEAGRRMRRGWIVVGGATGEGFGRGMIAGSMFAFGALGRYAGLGMKRGTIAAFGESTPALLPSFAPSGRYRFPFLTVYLRRLTGWGFPVPGPMFSADLERYNGDLADGGQGEILVWARWNES